MAKFCGNCGQKLDSKTGLCPQCDQAMLIKKKKRNKAIRAVIAMLCCISIIAVGILGALRFFNKDSVSYTYDEYNSFMESFTDVRVTDEKSAIEAVSSVADVLGITDASKELKVISINSVATDKYYRMQQYYKDIPVYGRTVVLSADKDNNATALTSNFICITDDISLEPTITQKELERSLQKYFDDDVAFSVDDSDLVLYPTERDGMVLCYEINVSSKRIVIDANTAEILVATNLYVQDMVECKYKDGTFQGMKISENNYQIGDEKKGIFVFNANYNPVIKSEVSDGKTTFISVPENSLPMTSTDNYFGNNDSFAPEEYAKAVYMLNTLQSISSYYEQINANQNTSVIVTINDSFDPDNAFGGYGDIKSATSAIVPYEKEEIISIFFGQNLCNDIYGHLDTLGHEYMHGINHSFFKSDKDEASAIDEAYADIFGELSEAMVKKQSPNWIHGQRNMVNPHDYANAKHPYPASINDLEKAKTFTDDGGALWYHTTANSGTDFSHFASTIISHCAYLMWNGIDGSAEGKIQQLELGELWYRSLLFLQDNADFEQCRNAVELSARAMLKNNQLTEEQYKTVVAAFERVGIENAAFTYTEIVKNKFDLSVLSNEETENVNYKLEVIKMPIIKSGPGIVNETPKKVMEKTAITGRQSLDLEDGTYVLRITDVNDDRSISQSINIKIVVDGDNGNAKGELIVNTDFTDVIVVILNEKPSDSQTEGDDTSEQKTVKQLTRMDTYDENGNMSQSIRYAYDGRGLLQSKTIWKYNSDYNSWETQETTSYSYNDSHLLIQEIWYNNCTNKITDYKYDEDGNLTEKSYGSQNELEESCVYTYGENGQLKSTATKYYGDGNEVLWEETEEFFYDANGHRTHSVLDGIEEFGMLYTYDTNGNLIKEENRYGESSFEWTHTYNEKNQCVFSTWSALAGTSSTKYTYTYDDNGNKETCITEYDYLAAYGGPHKERTVYSYDYIQMFSTSDLWKQSYRKYIEEELQGAPEETSYYLTDMNGDNVPELLVDSGIYSEGMKLCTFDGTNVNSVQLRGWGSVSYIRKDGLVCNSSGHHGMFEDEIYRIADGQIAAVIAGSWTEPVDMGGYVWDGESVSKEDYEAKRNAAFPEILAISLGFARADEESVPKLGSNEFSRQQILSLLSEL